MAPYQGDGSIGAQLKDEPADILGHSTGLWLISKVDLLQCP